MAADEQYRPVLLLEHFERSVCGAAWVRWSRVRALAGIAPESAERFLKATSDLDESTAERRAQTLRAWLDAARSARVEAHGAPEVPVVPAADGPDDAPWTEDAARGAVRFQVGMALPALGVEGEKKLVTHFLHERYPAVRIRYLTGRERDGTLYCDTCGLDPGAEYGLAFAQILEVHHQIPVAQGRQVPDAEHLALLCPTCHRVAHHRVPKPRQLEEVGSIVTRSG